MEVLAKLAKIVLVPPASLYLLGILGWLLLRRRPRLGRSLLALCGAALIALSLPIVGHALYDGLSDYPALDPSRSDQGPGAIVILSAETNWVEEDGGDVPGARSFARLRYGARLHRRLQLPILLTGGPANAGRQPIAKLMAKALKEDFGFAARWQEEMSRNTYENALFSAKILRENDVGTVYLVTHVAHMARAKAAFEALGISVIPAPVGVPPNHMEISGADFLPNAHALATSAAAIYEYSARLWYAIRY